MSKLKKPEEYFTEFNYYDDSWTYSEFLSMIKEIQHDAYNQAIDDAVEHSTVEVIDHEELSVESIAPHDGKHLILPIYGVDLDSILKLKSK